MQDLLKRLIKFLANLFNRPNRIDVELNKYVNWKGSVVDYDYSPNGSDLILEIWYRIGGDNHNIKFVVVDGPSIFPTIAAEMKKRGHAS